MRHLFILVALMSFSAFSVIAVESEDEVYPQQEIPGDPIIISAEYFSTSASEFVYGVDIFDNDAVNKFYARDISAILERADGVFIRHYGGDGTVSSAAIRGSKSNQTLIMVDGQPMNDIQSGHPDLNLVHLDEIQQIEIYSGAASAIYGANAAGGVVNIITKANVDKTGAKVDGTYGTGGSQNIKFGAESPFGPVDLFFSGSYKKSDGYKSPGYKDGDEIRPNTDTDSISSTGKIAYRLNSSNYIALRAQLYQSEVGVPGSVSFEDPTARQEDDGNFLSLTYRSNPVEIYWLNAIAYMNKTERRYTSNNPAFDPVDDTHKGNLYGARFTNFIQPLSWNRIGVGFEYSKSDIDSTKVGDAEASNIGVFLQDDTNFGAFDMSLGARYDKNDNFDSEISPRIGTSYEIVEGLKVRGAYGLGYRAPSLDELFWPADTYYSGNANLTPEKVATAEGGISYVLPFAHTKTGITYFRSDYEDLIVNVTDSTTYLTSPQNVDEALISGIEIDAATHPLVFLGLGEYDLGIAVNGCYFLDRDNTTDENDVKLLDYRPEITGYAEITYGHRLNDNISVKSALNMNYVSSRQYQYFNPTTFETEDAELDAYMLTGAKISCSLWWFEPYFAVTNLLDKEYESVYDYPMPGREIFGGLTIEY